jgi:hypothetical protein
VRVRGDVVAVRAAFILLLQPMGTMHHLNVLAGERRSMAASDDPKCAHFRREWRRSTAAARAGP